MYARTHTQKPMYRFMYTHNISSLECWDKIKGVVLWKLLSDTQADFMTCPAKNTLSELISGPNGWRKGNHDMVASQKDIS